eukprot:scpid82406/ scgid9639/ 
MSFGSWLPTDLLCPRTWYPFITRTQRVGAPLKRLEFAAFANSRLCPTVHLLEYARRSATWHPDCHPAQLLVSFRKPHRPVSSPTIACWLKEVMRKAGIDPAFLAHSTRGASTSAAASGGVSTDVILAMVDWRQESTFRRFYHRPSSDVSARAEFGSAVLQLSRTA